MPEPEYTLTLVEQSEFDMLTLLPDYQRSGGDLARLEGGHMFVTMLQTSYDRLQALTAEVECGCSGIFESLLEMPIAAEITAPSVPPKTQDQLIWERLHPDTPTEYTTGRDRPRDGGGLIDFSPLF
jgi:hypothetical protein